MLGRPLPATGRITIRLDADGSASTRSDGGNVELCHGGALFALWAGYYRNVLKYDLSYQNSLMNEMIADSTIATQSWRAQTRKQRNEKRALGKNHARHEWG